MKISKLTISNFRSLQEIEINPQSMLALVGRNNSGKSNVLKALEFFFSGSKKLINEESFFKKDIEKVIEVKVWFSNLSEWEKSEFEPWMEGEELIVSREASYNKASDDFEILVSSFQSQPNVDWLNQEEINGTNITKWWKEKEELKIGDKDFSSYLGGSKPSVGDWKEKAAGFTDENKEIIEFSFKKNPNPKGYSGVLSGTLPEFIYIPAVKDVLDEAKVQRTNPFGMIINSILENIEDVQKQKVEDRIEEVKKLFRKGSEDRISQIDDIEDKMNLLLSELIDCTVELDIGLPQIDVIFSDTKIIADDGIQTAIDMKGHGLQRTMIFTILRAYVELAHMKKAGDKAKERSTIFAFEEPELYLHPQFQRTLYQVFREISKTNDQVLYSTQSSLFVDISYFDEIAILRREKKLDYSTTSKELKIEELLQDLKARKDIDGSEKGIRELYFNTFNSFINEGFFSDKVLIVEGDSELYSLPIYSKALGFDFDRNNVSIVHSHGKGTIDRILRIFNGFGIPTYIWIDGDINNQDKKITDKSLELLGIYEINFEKIEEISTIHTPDITVLRSTFEEELKEELKDNTYDEILENAKEQLGPTGKPLKHRYLANSLAQEAKKEGNDIKEIIPEFIKEIVKNISKLEYSGLILKSVEEK